LGTDNCSADATCTNTTTGFTCACKPGFSGDGVSCADVDECAIGTANCSADATCTNAPGTFSCACNPGFSGDGVTCTPIPKTCDLTGTFATLVELDVEWDPVQVLGITVIAGGSDTLYSWSLRKLVQTGTTISTQSIGCGDTSPDLCSGLLGQALTQNVPANIWGTSGMPVTKSSLTLSAAPKQGDPFVGPLEVTLLGLDLANPSGAWPASYDDAAITWLDHDGDGHPGVTANIVTSGRSSACNLPYAALPIPATGELATQVFTGSRSLANLSGTIVDCDTIRGEFKGPRSGLPALDGHVAGCVKDSGSLCTPEETASLDASAASAQRLLASRFVMVRVPDATSCSQVRALDFP
jgi:hypothetical protein